MNTDQAKNKVAQPADEELKKHGDKLEQQVRDAAATQSQEKRSEEGKQALDD